MLFPQINSLRTVAHQQPSAQSTFSYRNFNKKYDFYDIVLFFIYLEVKQLNMKIKTLKFLKLLMMLCLFSTSISFAQTGGCAHCIENSTNCDAVVIIDFWCNGLQITNNTSTTIPAKTLYCPTWQSTYPSQCNPCDMTVKFVSLGGAAIGAPNLLSISNPGPIAPDLS